MTKEELKQALAERDKENAQKALKTVGGAVAGVILAPVVFVLLVLALTVLNAFADYIAGGIVLVIIAVAIYHNRKRKS